MKIMVIASYAPSLLKFRGDLMQEMLHRGHKVVAVAPDIADVSEQLRVTGISCRLISLSRTGLNPARDLRSLMELRSLIRQERPDQVLAYTIKPVIYGSLAAARFPDVSMFSMITGLGYAFIKGGLRQRLANTVARLLYRRALRTNAAVFFQNRDDRQLFIDRKILASSTRVCMVNGSGVNTETYALAPLPGTPSVLLIARLIADKGIREYVKAARIVKARFPKARFELAGWFDSNPRAISEQEVKSWQQEGLIDYLGELEDVRPAIRRSRIYVLPSYREGTPRTVLEAMSMGRAIVTTDVPGCRETVKHAVNGLLVPARDVQALANAIIQMLEEPADTDAMGSASRRIVLEKFDVRLVNQAIISAMGL